MSAWMDALGEWVKNLAAFFILSTIVTRLLPDESCRRYGKMFLGLLLMLLLLQPFVSSLFDGGLADLVESVLSDGNPADTAESVLSGGTAVSAMEEEILAASAGEWSLLLESYEEEILAEVNDNIADLGWEATRIAAAGELLYFYIKRTSAEEETGNDYVQIEIPVIRVFQSGENKDEAQSTTDAADADTVRERIAQCCGLDAEEVEVVEE